MKVSIITVCYNSSEFIRSAIESVLTQTYPDVEYIIIDGGSNDGTLPIINEYSSQLSHIVSEPDKGIYDAMNKGIALATGDVIGILNSDDFYLDSHSVSDVMEMFHSQPKVDMVLGNIDFVKPFKLSEPVRLYSAYRFSPWKLRFGVMPAHPGTFIKKIVYEKYGLYKVDYQSGADFDIFVRMLLIHKLSYVKLNKVLVRMRLGGVSTLGFKSYIISTNEMLRSLNENQVYSNLLMVLLRLPVKFTQRMLFKVLGK